MFKSGSKHLVGDYRSGWIYEQKETYHSDAGAAIRQIRSSPDLTNSGSGPFTEALSS